MEQNKIKKNGLSLPGISATGLCGCLLFMVISTPSSAEVQPQNTLRQLTMDFLQAQTASETTRDIEISVGNVDSRLKLTPCHTPPTPFLAAGARLQGKLTVGLRCAGPKPWTVYVPAQINIYARVITATAPLLRGNKISASDVKPVRQEISQIHGGYFLKKTSVIGKVLKQNIAVGHPITPKRIKAPTLVHRGEKVAIVVSVGSLKVRGKGEALRDAAQGERVSVRNSRSKRIVQGIVSKPGVVNVQM